MLNKIIMKTGLPVLNLSRLVTCFIFILLCSINSAWGQQSICFGSIKHYAVDTSENAGLGTSGSTYNWTVIGGLFSGTITPTVSGSTNKATIDWGQTPSGTYTVSVIETSNLGCISVQNLQVIITPFPVVHLNDKIICVNPITGNWLTSANLDTGLSPSLYSFVWQKDGIILPNTTSSINVTEIGVYSVTVTNISSGCQSTDSATISVSSATQAAVTIINPFADVQNIVVTILNGIGNYEFSIDGINFQDSGNFSVSTSGIYTIIVRDKYFCGTISLPVFASGFPKFFTPNGDGNNDFWNITALPNPTKSNTYIFDRYGKLIHQINSSSLGWDGTLDGYLLPATDYWFTVEYYDFSNNFQTFKSHFSLIR